MKTTITKTVTEEIELPEFPFFLKKSDYQYFKILNEEHCLAVLNFTGASIQDNYPASIPLEDFDKCKIITEQQFLDFYRMVLSKIEENL